MPETKRIISDDIKKLARGQAVVEARQPVEGECRILSASATACVRQGEVFAGEVRYTGKVRFDCIVLADGKPECVSFTAEFSDRIADGNITAGMATALDAEVINCEANVDGGAIKAIAVVDTALVSALRCECDCLTEPEQGVYAERKKVKHCTVVVSPTETLYISDSVGDIKATEALCPISRAVVTAAECATDEIKLSGAVYTTVLLRSADGMVSAYRVVTPFVKSISAPGATEDDLAFATVSVSDSTATLTESEDGNTLELAVTLVASATVARITEVETVADVFCADNELDVGAETLKLCVCEPLVTVIDNVDGQIPLDADRLAADSVLCVGGAFCQVSAARVEDGRVTVEGLTGGNIIYYNAENNAIDSLSYRIPFSMPLDIHTSCAEADVTAVVTDVTVRVRRESVFDVKTEIAFTARLSDRDEAHVITSVKRGAEIARPDATVIVHIAREGETLWQAAKALCCSPERVEEQNAATAPYAGGERLVNFCK